MRYADVVRPVGAPPAWLFGPVWSVIYMCYGLVGLVLASRRASVPRALWLFYAAGWVVNLLWVPLFRDNFVHYGNGAFIAALLFVVLNVAGLLWASPDRWVRTSALLLAPYAAWLAVATSLGFALFWLN